MRFARDTDIRKFVLLLGIWLLAAIGIAQEPARVSYTHRGTFDRGLAKVGNECWCSYDLARKWGWSIIPVGTEIDVQAEGRRIRLTPILNSQEKGIPLVAATEQLGGVTQWLPGNTLKMLGVVRDVEVLPDGIKIGSTLGVKPKSFKLDGPDRLVIDLEGAELPAEISFGLPANVRVGIVDQGVTRVVVESPKVRSLKLQTLRQGRKIDVSLPGFSLVVAKNPDGTPIITSPTPSDMAPRDPGDPVIGQAEVVRESEKETVLRLPYSGTVKGYPSASYLGPEKVSITLPTMALPAEALKAINSDVIKEVEYVPVYGGSLTVNVSLNRPMIFALSVNGQEIVLRLVKPNVRGGGLSGKIVVVDPGHGGKDSGATWGPSGTMEKNLTLAISRRLARELTEAGASVIMTRDDDRFIPLDERPAVANRSNADVFISVHINSNSVDDSASGIYSFYHMKDPTCILLAECIQTQMNQTGLPLKGIRSDTIRFKSGFAVLRGSQMPAVLLELGFINHRTDRSKITTSEFQIEAAKAVIRGLKVFFGNGQSNR